MGAVCSRMPSPAVRPQRSAGARRARSDGVDVASHRRRKCRNVAPTTAQLSRVRVVDGGALSGSDRRPATDVRRRCGRVRQLQPARRQPSVTRTDGRKYSQKIDDSPTRLLMTSFNDVARIFCFVFVNVQRIRIVCLLFVRR